VIREFSHKEEIDHGKVLPRIWVSKAYDDGIMVIRIIRKNATTSINNYLCFYEMFSLRIINLDGTVVEKNLKLDIQPLNYCVFQMISGDVNDPSTYVEWGMVMDFD
ncbi:16663_t:CDS:2, partial [Rhizophagus irregularis]